MKTKSNYFYTVLIMLIFTAVIFFNGCGKQDQNTVKKTDSTKTSDQKDNKFAGENQTKTDPKSNELGIKEGMPADYPADVPQPSNAKCLGSLNTSEGTVVTFESTDKPKVLLVPFAEGVEKSGFKKSEGEMMSDDGGMIMWTKDKREVSIMLAWDKEKSVTSIVVTYK